MHCSNRRINKQDTRIIILIAIMYQSAIFFSSRDCTRNEVDKVIRTTKIVFLVLVPRTFSVTSLFVRITMGAKLWSSFQIFFCFSTTLLICCYVSFVFRSSSLFFYANGNFSKIYGTCRLWFCDDSIQMVNKIDCMPTNVHVVK